MSDIFTLVGVLIIRVTIFQGALGVLPMINRLQERGTTQNSGWLGQPPIISNDSYFGEFILNCSAK
jgi:hypothetical protein